MGNGGRGFSVARSIREVGLGVALAPATAPVYHSNADPMEDLSLQEDMSKVRSP
jgi:hypothetical protein